MAPRTVAERTADTLRLLEETEDAWVASSGEAGVHLVPLSFVWDGDALTMTTGANTPTARNVRASGRVRVGVGPTRDVVMIEGSVEVTALAETPVEVSTAFVAATGWDPADEGSDWVYLRIRPVRIQAWRESDEIAGRTIMREGRWLA